MVEVVVCGNELVGPVGMQRVVVVPEVVGTQVGIVLDDDVGNVGNVPPSMVVDVVVGDRTDVVVEAQGTVVVDGSFGMHGGRVVDVVGTVGPDGPVVVVIPGARVVVVVGEVEVLVVVPADGAHPSDCNSDGKSPLRPVKAPNRASRDRINWQMGSRMAGSSWARVIRPEPSVCAPLVSGCPTTIPTQSASTHSPMRRRRTRFPTVILPPR